jgi:serine/threonine protein kinase
MQHPGLSPTGSRNRRPTAFRLFVVLGRGDVVGGFEIQRDLRSGPRGVLYEAVQVGVGRVVALRVLDLRLSRGHDPAFVERFRQQEWPQHPHIASVFEAGEWEHGLFVAMQLIRGDTITELLARGDLDQSAALAALTEVASALDSAHERGLAHGWVRPQAVLIDEDGWTWLVDFGLFPGAATPAADRTAFAALVRTCLGKRSVPRGSWETASALMQAVSARLDAQPDGGSGWMRRLRRGAPPPQ